MDGTLQLALAFAIVALAAHRIGRWFTAIGLPYITGYLGAGALVGSFGLDLLSTESAEQLRFVDEISLGVIAFVAGSELFLPDLRARLRPILSISAGIAVAGSIVLGFALYALTGELSFTADLDGPARLATAILGAAVLLALSPPSTIAVIKEVGARGPFTSTSLSVTIVMDVVVVVAFATAASIAGALINGTGLDVGFVGVLLLDLALAVGLGLALGRLLGAVLGLGLPSLAIVGVVLGAGFGVYELAGLLKAWSATNLPFEVYIEPLLLTMVAGFTVTNFTSQRKRFEEVLHDVGPAVYVAFFTLTGLSLKLDTLVSVLPAALALFVVRAIAIAIGAGAGARFAGATGALRSRTWMALITQAGIALGLAREAGLQFPELGEAFATLIIAVIVLNEILGPLFLKAVLERVGEVGGDDEERRALVYGIDRNARQLAKRLLDEGWSVTLADDDPTHVGSVEEGGGTVVLGAPSDVLRDLDHVPDAVVAITSADATNLELCRAAVAAGVDTTVARLSDPELLPDFHQLGTLVIDPTQAGVALLQEAVRNPDAASLVLHADEARDTVRVVVRSVGPAGRELRDLRLPQDVLVLAVRHGRTSLVPDGFTRIRRGDVLTLLGESGALREAVARLGT
jgi:Trk K+ transport system NAD-binding subunit